MLQNDEMNLTDVQRAHALAFDERTPDLPAVDFDRYQRPQFGPWNPYWHVFDHVSRQLSSTCRRLLVVGCGNGRDALIYAHLGFEVHAFDISPRAIEIGAAAARRYGLQERITFSVQPAEKLNYDSDFFNLVVGVNVLHHVDLERTLPELRRVLRPGGHAIFKEPLLTPMRERIRNTRLVTWLIPKGFKSIPHGKKYDLVEGEKNLDAQDFDLIRSDFVNLSIKRWHVLAKLSVLISRRPFLERCDWVLFRMLPFMRRLGDQAVLTFEKPAENRS